LNRSSNGLPASANQRRILFDSCNFQQRQTIDFLKDSDSPEPEIEYGTFTTPPSAVTDSVEFLNELQRMQQSSEFEALYLLEDAIED
jgi:hypothetical protein